MPESRLLAVTYGLPWPLTEGAKIRDFNLLRELAKSMPVSVLAFCKDDRTPADAAELRAFCERVETFVPPPGVSLSSVLGHLHARRPVASWPFYNEAFAARIADLSRTATNVQIEHSFLAPYVTSVPAGRVRVLSLHNIGEQQYQSLSKLAGGPAARLKALAMRGWEADWARRFDACVAVSEPEAAWLEKRAPGVRVAVVDNGVDCHRLQPLPQAAGTDLLFIGVLGYPPNADAVLRFVAGVLPRIRRRIPEARLVVVGRNPGPEILALAAAGSIELHQDVPDVLPYYRRARLCVVPLRAGGGTRLKILEAMALGRAVVSTAIGCEGLDVRSGNELMIADDPDSMASAVLRLLEDRNTASEVAARARIWVEGRHHWPILGARLTRLHQHLSARKAHP